MVKNCKFKLLFSICCLVLLCSVKASNETASTSSPTTSMTIMPENKTAIAYTKIANISTSKKTHKTFGSLEFTRSFSRVLITSTKNNKILMFRYFWLEVRIIYIVKKT